MSVKDVIEQQKKPIILGVVGVVLIIVLIVVFAPFGGTGKTGPAKAITKKAKIDVTAVAPATQTAKVEPSPAVAPAGKEAASAKPAVTSALSEVKPAAKKPAGLTVEAAKKTSAPEVKPAAKTAEASKELKKAEKKPAVAVAVAEEKPAKPEMPARKAEAKRITKRWAVNVVSVAYKEEAEGFVKKLKAAGYNAYITKFKKDDIDWHRVRVGFYGQEAEARKVEKTISVKYKIDTPWAVKASRKEVEKHTK